MYERLKADLNSDIVYTTNFENTLIKRNFYIDFEPSDIDTENKQTEKDYLKDLLNQVEKKIDKDLLDFKHLLVVSDNEQKDYKYDVDKKIFYSFNNIVVEDKKKKQELGIKIQDLKSDFNDISLARDIFLQYSFLKKINNILKKEINLTILADLSKEKNDKLNLVNNLLSKTENMYLYANQKYLSYHPEESGILLESQFSNAFTKYIKDVSSKMKFLNPPKTFTDTIENSLNQYKSMVFNFLDPK